MHRSRKILRNAPSFDLRHSSESLELYTGWRLVILSEKIPGFSARSVVHNVAHRWDYYCECWMLDVQSLAAAVATMSWYRTDTATRAPSRWKRTSVASSARATAAAADSPPDTPANAAASAAICACWCATSRGGGSG